MLSQGVEKLWRMGNTTGVQIEVGNRIRTALLEAHFDPKRVMLRLQMLIAEKLVTRGGRGRHAGWWLTEEGVWEAKRWRNPTPTAVAKAN